MKTALPIAAAALALAAVGQGCMLSTPRATPSMEKDLASLQESLDTLPPFAAPEPARGSAWTDAGPGAALVRDTRAYRLNDLVRIRLVESSTGSNESSTDLTRTSAATFGAPRVFGLEGTNTSPGKLDWTTMLQTSTDSSHSGDGKTARSTSLVGSVTARVVRVLPNGDLVVAGQKTVGINREKQILTLVGSVRPVDIGPSNDVASSSVGDLTVRLWGNGEVDDTTRQGWFMRVMNRIWPF